MEQQVIVLREKEKDCVLRMLATETASTSPSNGKFCPWMWDGASCWPPSAAGLTHVLPCPSYVSGFDGEKNASKVCTPEGTWWWSSETNSTWTNYSSCYDATAQDSMEHVNQTITEVYLPSIKILSKVGYSISLGSLLVAFFVLAFTKKLRCSRNNLHLNLFASFMFRAFATLLKDNIFIAGIGLPANVIFSEGKPHFNTEEECLWMVASVTDLLADGFHQKSIIFFFIFPNVAVFSGWDCKIIISIWHYFLMANYCWILMEGLYLHNLIFLALFSDSHGILLYAGLGWGLPLLFIIPWAAVRAAYEDVMCWTTHPNEAIFWIIRGPITISIVINFFFFVNIIRILFLKLKSSYAPDSRILRYKKLARSTLVLVPLFGVHYSVFLVVSTTAKLDQMIEIVWLFCDQFFSSFQGFFVAILYCFQNGEVQSEVYRTWQRWYQTKESKSASRASGISQSLSYMSNQRTSLHSLTTSGVVVDPLRKEHGTPSPNPKRVDRLSCFQGNGQSPCLRRDKLEDSETFTRWTLLVKSSHSSLSCDNNHLAVTTLCPSPATGSSCDPLTSNSSIAASATPTKDQLSLPTLQRSETTEDSRLLASPVSDICFDDNDNNEKESMF